MARKVKYYMRVGNMMKGLTLLILAMGMGWYFTMKTNLDQVHEQIEADYANVEHIKAQDFSALNEGETVVFDVREQSEFAVSHIEGAIQVDPDMSAEDFDKNYGEIINGKTAVFYCSVGRRSSLLLSRLETILERRGALQSYNLIGGLFRWNNQRRKLIKNQSISTDAIHPYDAHWGRLVDNKRNISYEP